MPRSVVDSVGDGSPQSSAFEALVHLAVSLRGGGELNEDLDRLRELYRAERVLVARMEDVRYRCIAVADRDAGQLFSERRPACLAAELLRAVRLTLMPGKVLFLSALLSEGDVESSAVAREAFERTGLREAAIVILEARETGYDVLEVHFAGAGTHVQALLASMGPAMSRCWSSRLPGTATALAERTRLRPVTARRPAPADLLSPDNPAGLSRSEFRICALMREGMQTKRIARELAIRPTTLRAHLQSIYAKTGAVGQVELVHRLARGGLTAPADPQQATSRVV